MSLGNKIGYLFLLAVLLFGFIPFYGLTREQVYKSLSLTSHGAGDFEFLRKVIFEETGDIDILIAGHSQAWAAFSPDIIQSSMSQKYSRPFIVRNIGYNWSGEDLLYVLLRDLLSVRKVKVLVLGLSQLRRTEQLHPGLYELWSNYGFEDGLISKLDGQRTFSLMATRSYDWPRKFISTIRKDNHQVVNYDMTTSPIYGNLRVSRWMLAKKFEEISPTVSYLKFDEIAYSPEKAGFKTGAHIPNTFLDEVIQIAEDNGTQVVFIELPQLGQEGQVLVDKIFLKYGSQSKYVFGVSSKELFKGFSSDDLKKFFYDERHLNVNGSRLFTRAILPVVERVYEESIVR